MGQRAFLSLGWDGELSEQEGGKQSDELESKQGTFLKSDPTYNLNLILLGIKARYIFQIWPNYLVDSVIRQRWPDRRAWCKATRKEHHIETKRGLLMSQSSKKRRRRWSWRWNQAQAFYPSAPHPPFLSPCSLFTHRPTMETFPWKQGKEFLLHKVPF